MKIQLEPESLQEIQLDLERSTLAEKRGRDELNMLFSALEIIAGGSAREVLFSKLLAVFKSGMHFDDAFILASGANTSKEMKVIFSTATRFEGAQFEVGPLFSRVLRGTPSALFDVHEVEEWKNLHPSVTLGVNSALHVSIRYNGFHAILVCTHRENGFFGTRDYEISRKFSVLLAQALTNLDYVSALELEISDRKRAEKTLAERQRQIIQASKMAALGEMAGGIAHEVNNPLTVIQGTAEQLQEMLDEPELDRELLSLFSGTIIRTTHRISKIIAGLRSFSRDGTDDPFELVPVQTLIENALALCEESLSGNNIAVKREIPPEIALVECHSTQIEQVLLNLIGNARDAIRERTEKWIQISVKLMDDSLGIEITDSGPGIPEPIRQKLFQPFFTTKPIGKGTGLGLSISKGLIELHHGSIEFDSNRPNTTFRIRLPIKRISGGQPTPNAG